MFSLKKKEKKKKIKGTIPNVLIVIITDGEFCQESFDAANNQDYPFTKVLVHSSKYSTPPINIQDKNNRCAHHRNSIIPILKATVADYFLWIDMDVVLPLTAVSSFMAQMNRDYSLDEKGEKVENNMAHLMGGWVPFKGEAGGYAVGKFVGDNILAIQNQVQPGIMRVDTVGMGCMIISRELLESSSWDGGNDLHIKNQYGQDLIAGEGAAFCEEAFKKGITTYVDGSVVCQHLILNNEKET
jgi:hypothetical protein